MILKFTMLVLTALSLSVPIILLGMPHENVQGQVVGALNGYQPRLPPGQGGPKRSGRSGSR